MVSRSFAVLISVIGIMSATLTGCGVLQVYEMAMAEPLTPEQSRSQVVDTAREMVAALRLPVLEAYFWRAACSEDRRGPFRGQMRIAYPLAADRQTAETEMAVMIERLVAAGWSGDPTFRSHSAVLTKDNVHALLRAQAGGAHVRNIELIGECRDFTTTRGQAGGVEAIHLMDT